MALFPAPFSEILIQISLKFGTRPELELTAAQAFLLNQKNHKAEPVILQSDPLTYADLSALFSFDFQNLSASQSHSLIMDDW